ncbi:hypothetical protein G2W53_040813 [Senna tora]|uniref:MULE transposase domain-containing protein n=1 Tax=Senna tora TaxID=362788 RepID=A0A834SE70_9FABA|nr:hypothetical protein G2W53_040813 [Senna tora]
MMNYALTMYIYEDAAICEEANGVAFRGNNHPKLTSINRGITFEGLRQLVHQTLRLQPYQQAILAQEINVAQNNQFRRRTKTKGQSRLWSGCSTVNIPTAAPNDNIGDEEYEDTLMGNDSEVGDYEQEEPNDYKKTPYDDDISELNTWTEDDDLQRGDVLWGEIHRMQVCEMPGGLQVEGVGWGPFNKPCQGKQKKETGGRDSEEGTTLHRVVQECMAGQAEGRTPDRRMPGDDSLVQFKRLFLAFKPYIDARWQLKPMLQVDGTFLYDKYKHPLLIVMGQNRNNNIVLVTFALLESEIETAWS